MLLRGAPLLLALSLLTSGCDGPRRVRVGVVGCNRRGSDLTIRFVCLPDNVDPRGPKGR
jgi:hypothetical protein